MQIGTFKSEHTVRFRTHTDLYFLSKSTGYHFGTHIDSLSAKKQLFNRERMKTTRILFLLITAVCCCSACTQRTYYSSSLSGSNFTTVKASKQYVEKQIDVKPFSEIKLVGSPDVVFTQKAGKPEVKVYTSDNIVELLDIRTEQSVLYIGFKKGVSVNYDKLEISVTSPTLNQVSVSGSGEVQLKGGLKTEDLRFKVTGSGSIYGSDIHCNHFQSAISGSGDIIVGNLSTTAAEARITGSGDISLNGTSETATFEVTGSGDLAATDLVTKRVSAKITGSGDIKCHATEQLTTHVTGSGNISYKGNPTIEGKNIHKL